MSKFFGEADYLRKSLQTDGKAKDDHGGIIQYYEKPAKVQVRKNEISE